MPEVNLVIITEGGRLEAESKMLIESIRTFGGRFKNIPIFSYQPRQGFKISQKTKIFFDKQQVHHMDIVLNVNHPDYPLSNKIYVMSHAEKTLTCDNIVWMDSDSVVWNEPIQFFDEDNFDVGMVPVFKKFAWAVLESDENFKYWKRMFEVIPSIGPRRYIRTVVGNKKALAYYNSGLIISKRKTNFLQKNASNFDRLMTEDQNFFKQHFVEQALYAVTAQNMDIKFEELERGYNYPLYSHGHVTNPDYKLNSLDEVITGHYTILFKKAGNKNPLKGKLIKGEKGEWFKAKATEHGLYKFKPWYKIFFNL